MEKLNNAAALRASIRVLERRQEEEWTALKEQAHLLSESLQPANISKRLLSNLLTGSPGENGMVDQALGLGAGLAAKKIITVGSRNPLIHLLGTLAEKVVARTVSQNADGIKDIAGILFRKLMSKPDKKEAE